MGICMWYSSKTAAAVLLSMETTDHVWFHLNTIRRPSVVVYVYNPNTRETENRRSLQVSGQPGVYREGVPSKLGLHSETLSQSE